MDYWTMPWWSWLLFGLVMLGVELLTPGGFFILFFGVGALVVGILAAFNVAGPLWVQWLLFSVLSIVSLLLFRKRLLTRFRSSPTSNQVDRLIGELGTAMEDLHVGREGKVELRGTAWNARNATHEPIPRNARIRVTSVNGLTLTVSAVHEHTR